MRNGFLSCHKGFLLVSGLRKAVLVVALICLTASTVSCRTYVDSNGVWHQKEKETLNHYIYRQDETHKAREAEYNKKISELEEMLSEKEKAIYVEKELNWFQKALIGLGVCFVLSIVIYIIRLFFKCKSVI